MILSNRIEAAKRLKNGQIGYIPTDTIYGFSTSVYKKESVERIYKIKNRELEKPFLILIPSEEYLEEFGIDMVSTVEIRKKYWPGPVTLILDTGHEDLAYLHRNLYSLGFRLPAEEWLIEMLNASGPLVSTSANSTGFEAVNDLEVAVKMFGNEIDFFLNRGFLRGNPSKIIKFSGGEEVRIRG